MRFINAISYSLAHSLTTELKHSHEKKRVYYYAFQVIIGSLVKGILLILLTLLLGTFKSTFTVLFFFAALRLVAGGYHMNSYTRCMITSFSIFILFGMAVEYTSEMWSITALIILSLATFAAAMLSTVKYAPADTPFKPITRPDKIKNLKIISIIVVLIWMTANILLLIGSQKFYVLAGCLGILMAAFIISPAGYRFFGFISQKRKKSGGSTNT